MATMRRTLEDLNRAARLSCEDWLYLALAMKELLLARVRHATRPIGDVLRDLNDTRSVCLPAVRRKVDLPRLSWALGAVAARSPWRADCLLQAMAADRWLRRHGHAPEFFLGVAAAPNEPFGAHAWLRCDGVDVTGGNGSGCAVILGPSRLNVVHADATGAARPDPRLANDGVKGC